MYFAQWTSFPDHEVPEHPEREPEVHGDAYGYYIECDVCHQRIYANTITKLLERWDTHPHKV